MSFNGIRYGAGAALPNAHEVPAGGAAGTRTPHTVLAAAQHAVLSARSPVRGGDGSSAPRMALGKLSQGLGHRLEGAAVQARVLGQVRSGEIPLAGRYPAERLAQAVGLAMNGLAALKRDFPGV